jgi:predicted  nucleic acid-binding Zn-ribbon protein
MTRLKARIAELEKENQTLAEDVSDKIESITELMELVEKYKSQKADLEEELEASKRKEKESRELADPYTLYCEASAESLPMPPEEEQ